MNEKEALDELLTQFPEFDERWKKHLEYWEGDKRGFGIDLDEFGAFVLDKLSTNEPYDYKKVFDFIEKLVVEGNEYVSTMATTMFLEGLTNSAQNQGINTRLFTKFMGPESKAYCIAWDKFTDGKKIDGLYD